MKKFLILSFATVMMFSVAACGAEKKPVDDTNQTKPVTSDVKKTTDTGMTKPTTSTGAMGQMSADLLKSLAPAIDKWQEASKTAEPTAKQMEGYKDKYEYFMKNNSGAIMEYMKANASKSTTTPKAQ